MKCGYYAARGHRAQARPEEEFRWVKCGRIWLKLRGPVRSGGNIFWDWVQTFPFYSVELLNYLRPLESQM